MTPSFDLLDTALTPGVTLLEASAGTGKTYALAAIYLRLVAEESLTVRQIAVTTYTVPATAELRDRIRARLAEAALALSGGAAETPFVRELADRHAGNQAMAQRLADAVRDFDEASISTIHGFCQRILSDRAFESGAAPEMELIAEQGGLLREVAEDFWRQRYAGAEPGPTPFALLAKLDPPSLVRLYSTCANQPGARFQPSWKEQPAAERQALDLLTDLRQQWPEWEPGIRKLFVSAPTWAIGDWDDSAYNESQLVLVHRLATDPMAPLLCYEALPWFRISSIQSKKGISKKAAPPAHPFLDWCETFFQAVEHFAAATKAAFLHWAEDEIARRRRAQNILGFEDLLKHLHAALQGPGAEALKTAVRERFRASLVDEFQDTDPIQDSIFRSLFAEDPTHRLFLIGDPKQAIYGFRGADLHTYQRAKQRAPRHFALKTNYRSDQPLIQAVNHLFLRPSAAFGDGLRFEASEAAREEDDRLLRVNGQHRAPFQFHFWEEDKPITKDKAQEVLPETTAQAIQRLVEDANLDARPLRPSDVAVLCWTNAQCLTMQATLVRRGLPAVVLNSESVLQSREAGEMRTVLAALARPLHESGMRAALATSLFGFDSTELEELTVNASSWETWLQRFTEAHATWRDRGFIQMFRELLRDGEIRPRLLRLPDGERRLTNFLHLSELLQQAAREHSLGPAALVRWLAEQMEAEVPVENHEVRLESDEDAVKVLTIHKSKGLEWPVVFCPFLWAKSDLHKNAELLFHDANGKAVLDLGSEHAETSRQAATAERLAEHVRLLYVALTRARHECHVVWGQFRDGGKSALMWLLETPPDGQLHALDELAGHAEALGATQMWQTLQQLVDERPAWFGLNKLDPALAPNATPVLARTNPDLPAWEARAFRGRIDRSWKVSSFSSLTAGLEAGHDYDADERPRPEVPLQGIHAFPKGARAGTCLHDIFEHLDFPDDICVEKLVAQRLRLHELYSPEHVVAVSASVRQTLRASLFGAELRRIPKAQTLRELEFHLPARELQAHELAAVTGIDLHFDPRRGLLTGFIDLIFEFEGQYHIVDWKSNWLGPTEASYTPEAVAAEMARHRYGLQWRLYLLALHRFLRLRLRDYDPSSHLGGVHYLFFRGLSDAEPSLGLFQTRPDLTELAALDSLFGS